MIGHYPWTYADQQRRRVDRPSCEYEDLFTAEQMHAFRAEGVAQQAAEVQRLRAALEAIRAHVEQQPSALAAAIRATCERGLRAARQDGAGAQG